MLRILIPLICIGSLGACASLPKTPGPDGGVAIFENEAQLDRYVTLQERELDKRKANGEAVIIVTASKRKEVQITNVQEEGVDEGGIVKANSEFVIVFRQGRIHVIRHGADGLETVDAIDAFPPGDDDPDDTWYDEMLLSGDMIVTIGYSYGDSYGEDGTEISRFRLSDDGKLSYVDTHYLNSEDYYSSRNYASRLVDGNLLTYTPTTFDMHWRERLPYLQKRLPDGSRKKIGDSLPVTSIGISSTLLEKPDLSADVVHGITSCDLEAVELVCNTRGVIGSGSRNFYFSREAAYIWTDASYASWIIPADEKEVQPDILYRIPLVGNGVMQAASVLGSPVDQFSFSEDEESESLFVFVLGDNYGDGMWGSEYSEGVSKLLQFPLDDFGDGSNAISLKHYRSLPSPESYNVRNRYVGRHFLYGGSDYDHDDSKSPALFVTPLDAQWVQKINLPHGVSRLDSLGEDAVAIGQNDDEALGFSAIALSKDEDDLTAEHVDTYLLPAADEGENRSHAFFFRPDPDNPKSGDGLMALPVNTELDELDLQYLGSSTAMTFLERKGRKLAPAGQLGTEPDDKVIAAATVMEEEEDCKASCVDWYGNARPIFLGNRIFALMGYELIEGKLVDGQVQEIRRIDFTPTR